jgi:prolyl-tRNA synthetase
MVMVHSDDKGLVIPPRVAPTQIVIIPIVFKVPPPLCAVCLHTQDQQREAVAQYTPPSPSE